MQPEPVKPLSAGDLLDKAALMACLGGRFSPGIDLTFTVRQPEIYVQDWRTKEVGPFRIAPKPFDYDSLKPDVPVLSEGYVPLHSARRGSGRAGRHDQVHVRAVAHRLQFLRHPSDQPDDPQQHHAVLVLAGAAPGPCPSRLRGHRTEGKPGPQRYSVRGTGTDSTNPANQGRYQDIEHILPNWHKIGFVIQDTAIVGGRRNPDQFLEVQSELPGEPDPVVAPWPMNDKSTS